MTQDNEIKVGSAVFSFGDPCPPIESMFFPWDNKDKTVDEERKIDDSSQST